MEVKLLESDDNPNAEGLKVCTRTILMTFHILLYILDVLWRLMVAQVIYGDSTTAGMVTKAMAVVAYHNKKPKFFDEIKIQLPFQLTNKHHLMVTFYHIDCKPAGKKAKTSDKPIVSTFTVPLRGCGSNPSFFLSLLRWLTPSCHFLRTDSTLIVISYYENHY